LKNLSIIILLTFGFGQDYSLSFDGEDDGSCAYEEDCAGECGGDAQVDECGVCGGSGADIACWDGSYVCEANDCPNEQDECMDDPDVCIWNAVYNNYDNQEDCEENGGIWGGYLEYYNTSCEEMVNLENGCGIQILYWTVSALCPASCGVCCDDEDACNHDGEGSCEYAEENYDCDGNCIVEIDCEGVCDGSAVDDECGVCGGDSSSCEDCAGVPNGENVEDNCGTCDSDYSNDCVPDCNGEWGGNTILDECGVCGGSGIPDGDCDCDGNIDLGCGCGEAGPSGCDNNCGSNLELDNCDVCGGSGIPDGDCDCDGNVYDNCDVCGGDNTSCSWTVLTAAVEEINQIALSWDAVGSRTNGGSSSGNGNRDCSSGVCLSIENVDTGAGTLDIYMS